MSFIGEDGAAPASSGVLMADLNAGTFAAIGVLAAITSRASSGKGQQVETSLLESALAYTIWESGIYLRNGEIAGRTGSRHRLAAPYQALKTADGHVVIDVSSQSLWTRFLVAINRGPASIGEHSRDVLASAGYTQGAIDALLASDAIAQAS